MKNTIVQITIIGFVCVIIACTQNQLSAPDNDSKVEITSDTTVYENVDDMPEFIGGKDTFYSYVQNILNYPLQAKRLGVEGKVYVEFVVKRTGKIENVKVLKGIGSGCDEAALELIRNSPNWVPGTKDGNNVNVKLVLPIHFKLS